MKSVLISIQPKWCELIASGKKTVEVRKTKPKLETPFKVYIYCTKAIQHFSLGGGMYATNDTLYRLPTGEVKFGDGFELLGSWVGEYDENNFLNGKVIGEFVCDEVKMSFVGYNEKGCPSYWDILDDSCFTPNELVCYGEWKTLYGWHISNLIIYDKPKELSDFINYERCPYGGFVDCKKCGEHHCLKRPPQSWCYVEGCIAK